jgi:hypothetical protein
MKTKILIVLPALVALFILNSCTTTKAPTTTKADAYRQMYRENPKSILIMMPVNKTVNVEAKEFFYTTLATALSDQGYYVMPPFMSQEILRREGANDSEVFLEAPLKTFGEVFGVDAVLFTIIHTWKKDAITDNVNTEVEYILKSTRTNEILFHRKGDLIYDTTVQPSSGGGLAGLVVSAIASKILTAATSHVKVARMCNRATLIDMPAGRYLSTHKSDSINFAGLKEFTLTISSN